MDLYKEWSHVLFTDFQSSEGGNNQRQQVASIIDNPSFFSKWVLFRVSGSHFAEV